MKIAILNYNIGNLSSVQNALLKLGIKSEVISNANLIKSFDKVILPGVGAFGDAIEHLKESGMSEAIIEFAKGGKYIFGICLGMQLLFDKSYEFGEHNGLGLIGGEVVKFEDSTIKIPHMGWNKIKIIKENPLLQNIKNNDFLYFVHSFYVKNKDMRDVLALCEYDISFSAIVAKDNILGIQPHPEKSSLSGLKILENFALLK